MQGPLLVHYLPILTTLCSIIFAGLLLARYRKRPSHHLFWWILGVTCYGLGTFIESCITLAGNSVLLTKTWYIAGAILGGYPLAQGSVYLLLSKRQATIGTWLTLPLVILASVLVIASPVVLENLQAFRPSGNILAWHWVRLLTPIINLYAATFLIGGAVLSAISYFKQMNTRARAIGTTIIAVGALLPGIGGSMAKVGIVEALYIGEFIGLLLIWYGDYVYRLPQMQVESA